MEVASRDTSYLSVRHIFQHFFFFLFSSISSYDALLHVTRFWRGGRREKKWGKETGEERNAYVWPRWWAMWYPVCRPTSFIMAAPFKGSQVPAIVEVPVKPHTLGESQMLLLTK